MAANMHLKFGDIAGEDKTEGYEGQIIVLGWSFSAKQPATMHNGGGGGASSVDVEDVTVVKYVDKASPNLFKLCCNGKHTDLAELFVQKAGGDQLEYLHITMNECIISSYEVGESQGSNEQIKETIKINCARMKVEYTPQEGVGSGAGGVTGGWDMAVTKEYA